MNTAKKQGFTLMEMVIVVAIISILSLIALTLYSAHVRKGRRVDAISSLLSISLAEEQYRASNTQYGTLAQVWSGVTTSAEGFYTLSISNISATGYTATATGIGDQANDRSGSTSCSPMQITVSNGTLTKTPAVCWPT